MLLSSPKLGFLTASLIGLSCLASTAVLAAETGTTKRPHTVATTPKVTKAALKNLDCGPVIYDYGGTQETKTVCSAPWTGPATGAESGPSGSSSSASQ